jgi:hypothetical protein
MELSECKVGMKVIPNSLPTNSSYHYKWVINTIKNKEWKIVRIDGDTIYCYDNARHTAWGNETHPERHKWFRYSPEQLMPFTPNNLSFFLYLIGEGGHE